MCLMGAWLPRFGYLRHYGAAPKRRQRGYDRLNGHPACFSLSRGAMPISRLAPAPISRLASHARTRRAETQPTHSQRISLDAGRRDRRFVASRLHLGARGIQ
jgi:hypothetical protein